MRKPVQIEKIVEKQLPSLRFDVSGGIISRFGKESISNKNIAILELIKNSFDAHAEKVDISLTSVNTKDGTVVLSDDGDGMDYSDLQSKWMRIAGPSKSKKIMNGDRVFIGEKGIGRLSAESLGMTSTLYSFPRKGDAAYKLIFDWEKYQDENVLIGDVGNLFFELKKKKGQHGVRLECSKLNHDWNDQKSQESLLVDIGLINPINRQNKNFKVGATFSPSLSAAPKPKKEMLEKAVYHLKAHLKGGNNITYEFSTIKGKSKKGTIKIENKLSCGDAEFELYFFYKSTKHFENATGDKISNSEMQEVVKFLKYYSGIKIYRDNFRVKPYGDTDNDWMNLGIAAHNNSMMPRLDAVVGVVHIGRLNNPKISDTTTREGIVLSNEFQDLMSFVSYSVRQIFVNCRSEFELHKSKARKVKTKKNNLSAPIVIPRIESTEKTESAPDFIDIGGKYPENFYTKLQDEINNCYASNFPNAAFFLCRKMVENLVYSILETKFPNRVDLYFDTSRRMRLMASVLIKNLYDERANFNKPNVAKYIEKFNSDVGPFVKDANSKAHNVYEYLSDKSELKQFKINDLIQMLVKIFNNI